MYKEEAIPFVTYDQSSRSYGLAEQAASLLRSITSPIAVISVAGLYRTGKSYLLNRILLNRSNGFGVGPTVNPCTKGLWVWGTPIMVGKVAVLIVDSEGTGAMVDSDVNHDTRIFALAVLLASTFVYNSVGAIDEGALEALGLVVNLTKFIQLKSNEEPDQEDYQDVMPQFCWVLRDFSLQLLDSNGDQLTPHQYLEKSLQEQPGFSDGVEEKNRIRRLLRTFFPDRECFTLVRPVMKENQLQNLQKLDWDQLRPEFSEQALILRKLLTQKVKPKQYNGKTINGNMFTNLVQAYLEAINNGGIANIETSWTYVFREECRKAQYEAQDIYERSAKESLQTRIPTTEEELKALHRQCRVAALQHMNKTQIGDVGGAEQFITELKSKLKQRWEYYSTINEQESQSICRQFLQREFAPIERKLKLNEYRSHNEFERDIKLFDAFLEEHGPKVYKRRQQFNEFLLRMSNEGATFFVQTLNSQYDSQKKFTDDSILSLQVELASAKSEYQRVIESQSMQIKNLTQQNNELKQRAIQLTSEHESSVGQYQSEIEKLKGQSTDEITRLSQMIEETKKRNNELEESLRSTEREHYILQSESQKNSALLQQKVAHLQKQLDELNRKEKQYDNQVINSKNEVSTKIREITNEYENTITNLKNLNNQLNEKVAELSDQLMQIEIKYDSQCEVSQQKEEQQLQIIKKLQSTNATLQEQINQEVQKSKQLQDELVQTQIQAESNDLIEQLRQQLKQSESKLQEQKQSYLKQEAILSQQAQFLQMELEEKKQSIIDLKKSHDSAISALDLAQSSQTTQQQINKQIFDLKEQHLNELRSQELQHQQSKKTLNQQIEQLSQEVMELETKNDVYRQEQAKFQEDYDITHSELEQLKLRLQQQVKDQESNKYSIIKDKESRLNQRIKLLEEELSQCRVQLQEHNQSHQKNIEQQITELRNYYELEKDVLERRIHEERQKADQKYQVLFEEQEQRMRDDQQQYEEEIESLRDELREMELNLNTTQQQMENELELKNKSIQTLETILQETKEQLISLQNNYQQQVESRNQNHNLTVQQLESQINSLNFTNQTMIKENQQNIQKIEQLELKLNQRIEENKQQKEDSDKDKQSMSEKFEDLRKKYMVTCDEYLDRKINYEKAIALSSQQCEFFGKKVEELEKQSESCNQKYEERLKIQKQEWSQELSEKLQKLSDEKQVTDQKLGNMKKLVREKDALALKLQQDLDKEIALSSEKISYLESKLKDIELQTMSDSSNINQQLKTVKEQYSNLKLKSQTELEQYKQQLNHLEYERQELQANYEKDKILWAGKFQFLEAQRDQLKSELADTLKKFEATIQTLQKARNMERTDHNQDITEMLSQIERKYQDQVRDLQDQHKQKCDEYQEKIDRVERELKSLQNKDLFDQQGKLGSQFERKVTELLDNEKRLQQTIDELKQERDQRMSEHMEEMEQEKDYWKQKLNELEERLRESDRKHSQLIFFHEKERAKWNQEKDLILQQRVELQDSVQRLEKKKELLLRENEKMKNSSKSQRKYNPNQTYMGGNNGLNSSYLKGSDKKIGGLGVTKQFGGDVINMSCDVSKSLEDEAKDKENLSTSSTFGSFKKYYQMMSSKQVSPTRGEHQQQQQQQQQQ